MTFPICMIGLPVTPWMLAIAFVTNRIATSSNPSCPGIAAHSRRVWNRY
jgi:hypothetical protein